MKRIVIVVHGLGNQSSPFVLKMWWRHAFREGFRKTGTRPRRVPFHLVYWADINHPTPAGSMAKVKKMLTPRKSRGPDLSKKSSSRQRWLKTRLYRYLDSRMDGVFLNDDMSVRFETLTHSFLRRYFTDLDAYYAGESNPLHQSVMDGIQERLSRTLIKYKNREILLVAHSMGSIIAFDVLEKYQEQLGIHTLVTIGSPLGLPMVKSRIFQEQKSHDAGITLPHTPHSVNSQWFNLTDPEDKVALDPSLADDFAANRHGIVAEDLSIHNDYEIEGNRKPHNSFGYLSSPEMNRILIDFLSGPQSGSSLI